MADVQIWVPTLYGSSCVATLPNAAEAHAYARQFGLGGYVLRTLKEPDNAASPRKELS